MAQESYADFSIIQKYLDQKRYHDEEIRSYKAKLTEHENVVNTLRNKLEAKEQVVSQLNTQLNECKAQIKDKERGMQELSIQAHRLRKKWKKHRGHRKRRILKMPNQKKPISAFQKSNSFILPM